MKAAGHIREGVCPAEMSFPERALRGEALLAEKDVVSLSAMGAGLCSVAHRWSALAAATRRNTAGHRGLSVPRREALTESEREATLHGRGTPLVRAAGERFTSAKGASRRGGVLRSASGCARYTVSPGGGLFFLALVPVPEDKTEGCAREG